jgi:hypothetical protein
MDIGDGPHPLSIAPGIVIHGTGIAASGIGCTGSLDCIIAGNALGHTDDRIAGTGSQNPLVLLEEVSMASQPLPMLC